MLLVEQQPYCECGLQRVLGYTMEGGQPKGRISGSIQGICFLEYSSHTRECLAGMVFKCGTHTTLSCCPFCLNVWAQFAQVGAVEPPPLHWDCRYIFILSCSLARCRLAALAFCRKCAGDLYVQRRGESGTARKGAMSQSCCRSFPLGRRLCAIPISMFAKWSIQYPLE